MKPLLSLLLLFQIGAAHAGSFDHSAFNAVLQRHVDNKGMVDYSALKAERGELDAYLQKTGAVSKSEFTGWAEPERLAFLINLYNAETLQLIIDNYPVSSIKKLGGLLSTAWDKKEVTLFGQATTLNHLEHKIIRRDYGEPRIHFALVCAAKGCPPLRAEAFTSSRLDAPLDDQAKVFFAQSAKNRIEGSVLYLSPIFDWYGEDFSTGGKSLNEYAESYLSGDTSGKKVKFTDYDWSLNDRK